MKTSIPLLLFVCLFINYSSYSQNKENNWAIDIGSSSVIYNQDASRSLGYRLISLIPRINLTKYVNNDFSIAAGTAFSLEENKSYLSFDAEVRYGFGTTEKKIFNIASIYGILGSSVVLRESSAELKPDSVTLNFGAGGILWLSDRFGLNSRLVYKFFADTQGNRPRSHTYLAAGIVYQFSLGNKKDKKSSGGRRSRIWQ